MSELKNGFWSFFIGVLVGCVIILACWFPYLRNPNPVPVIPEETVPVETTEETTIPTEAATEEPEQTETLPPETVPPVIIEPTEPPVEPVRPVGKYYYTTASVLNVREGPGQGYKVIDVYKANTKVCVIDFGVEWAKIQYKNGSAYVSNRYLTTKDSYGTLSIPSAGLTVELFEKWDQKTVDAENSAAILTDLYYYNMIVVADHVHQGFSKIKSSIPGTTTLTIDKDDVKTDYICTDIFKGMNTGNDLTDMSGHSISTMSGDLCLYTCNSDGTITLTLWETV